MNEDHAAYHGAGKGGAYSQHSEYVGETHSASLPKSSNMRASHYTNMKTASIKSGFSGGASH